MLPTPESFSPPSIIFYTSAANMGLLFSFLLTHPQKEGSPEYSSTMLPHANEQEDPLNGIRKIRKGLSQEFASRSSPFRNELYNSSWVLDHYTNEIGDLHVSNE